MRSPAAAVRGRRSRGRRGGARDPARRSASRARPGDSCARPRRTTGITRTSSSAGPRAARSRRTPAPAPPLWLWGVWADLPFPTLIDALRRRRGWPRSSTRSRPTPRSSRACPSTGWSRRAPSSPPVWERSACTARASRAIPRSSWPSCSARSCSTPAGWRLGSPRRFDAEAPLASASERPIGWWLEAESVHARLRRGERPPRASQRT